MEDITSKTGNYKKFAVFVRMLQTAVQQQSDSVFVDLLTFQDLELLKSKKAAATGTANGTAGPPRQLPASNKRYLILTYASEFDRVHYPLPLLPEDQPDPQRLKAVIKQLRQQLGEVQAAQQLQQSQIVPQPRRRSSQQQVSEPVTSGIRLPHPYVLRLFIVSRKQQLFARPLLLAAVKLCCCPGGLQPIISCLLLKPQNAACPTSGLQGSSVSDDHDIALLSSRVEVLTVQLERERADHRRELRRKAQELQEVRREADSRDISNESVDDCT